MSDIKEEGYKTSETLATLAAVFKGYEEEVKKAEIKKYNSIFELKVKNAAGKETFWVIELKKDGEVKKGKATSFGLKPDVTIILTDETFMDIAEGRTTGQKAFMTGAVKTRGNMLLALKLDGILKNTKEKAKL